MVLENILLQQNYKCMV